MIFEMTFVIQLDYTEYVKFIAGIKDPLGRFPIGRRQYSALLPSADSSQFQNIKRV